MERELVRLRTGACGEVVERREQFGKPTMRVRLLATRDGRPYRKPPVVLLDFVLLRLVCPIDAIVLRSGAPFA